MPSPSGGPHPNGAADSNDGNSAQFSATEFECASFHTRSISVGYLNYGQAATEPCLPAFVYVPWASKEEKQTGRT